MKSLITLLLCIPVCLQAQTIKNNGFEMPSANAANIPAEWRISIGDPYGKENEVLGKGYAASLDRKIVHQGKRSLQIAVTDTNNFLISAIQNIPVDITEAKAIKIVAWIKTQDCETGAALNCTQFTAKGRQVGYTSSRQQEMLVKNTTNWTRSELVVLLRPEVKKLEIRTSLYGTGTVWFDDVSVESFSTNKQATASIVTAFTDTMMKIVKANSLYSDSINWSRFSKDVNTLQQGMQTYNDARLLANYIIGELKRYGDNHSSIMSPGMVKQFASNDLMGQGRKVEGEYLGDGVGYISMPGFGSMNDSISNAFARNAQQVIRKIDTDHNVCSWVVDLRDDNGGSCDPMIAGLGPILGEGMFIKDTDKDGTTFQAIYLNGRIYRIVNGIVDTTYITAVKNPYLLKKQDAPVAVLIGKGCGSSGEAAVASFIGRHNTKLFGQPTGGFTRGNSDYTLPDGSMLFLSSGIQTDRNGKKYPDRIFPDVVVDQPEGNTTDVTLDNARAWLKSLGCR